MKKSYNESGVTYAIRVYNQSEGFNLPDGWEDHTPGGDHQDSCAFCKGHNIGHYIVPTMDNADNCAPLPISVCYTCYDEITNDATSNWFHSQDFLSCGGTASWSSIVNDYIIPFVESGIYPEHDESDDSFESCDFCGNQCAHVYSHFRSFANIEDATSFNHILPVKKNVNLIEPPVKSCIRCESAIDLLTKRLPTGTTYYEIVMANCYNCNCSYPLKVEEYEARQEIAMKVPLNEYVCPLCAGEQWAGKQRWVTVECLNCKTERVYDRLEKNWFRGGYSCTCLPKQKDSNVPIQTLTFLYPIKGKDYHLSINIMDIECGGVKKHIFTVVDNDIKDDHPNVLPIGSTYEKCSQSAAGSCGCIPHGNQKDVDLYLTNLHVQIFEYLLNHDSS